VHAVLAREIDLAAAHDDTRIDHLADPQPRAGPEDRPVTLGNGHGGRVDEAAVRVARGDDYVRHGRCAFDLAGVGDSPDSRWPSNVA
jgi:hypothetical protein